MDVNSNQDWDSIGKNIQDIIDKAVNSKDFQKLNQAVSQIVERANNASASSRPRPVSYNPPKYTRTQNYQNHGRISPSRSNTQNANLPAVYGSTGNKTAAGIIKIVSGGVVAFFSVFGLIASLIVSFISGASVLIPSTLMMAASGFGAFLIKSGVCTLSHVNRFKTYIKVIGQKTYCSLEQLSRSVRKPQKFVKKELQKMIDEGFFLEGHLDTEETCLITSNETYRYYEQCKIQVEDQKRQQASKPEESAAQKPSPVQEVLDRGEAFLRQIHKCNIDIPGEDISKKISHMELLIARIFERAESHPEIVPDLKKLMDYYLPMTVKLLNAYAEMDRQPIQGDTIQASKREIETTLDTLNTAFEKLLDSIFKETAMDVSSDISVLQTLLAQEGLTEDELVRLKIETQSGTQ